MKIHTLLTNLRGLDPAMQYPVGELARVLGYAVEEVDKALKKRRFVPPVPHKAKRNFQPVNKSPAHVDETIVWLFQRGKNKTDIGRALGVAGSTVTKALERKGVVVE